MTMIDELLERTDSSSVALTVAGTDLSLTYEQLGNHVDALASRLREFGLGKGDRIATALPNGLDTVLAFLAAASVATAAPLNLAYKEEEFRFYLEDTGARALIVPPGGAPEARSAASESTLILEIECNGSRATLTPVKQPASQADSNAASEYNQDVALMLHTSGTTSRPKRVPLSQPNLMASVRNIAAWYQLGKEDVSLCVMPLFHVHGLMASTLSTFLTGGTVVVIPRFNALSFWSTVREHKASWYSAVPTIHQMLLARAKQGARPSGAEHLRFIRSCSAALAPRMMAEMEERFGAPVLEAYGMTEASHQMASNPLPPSERKAGSVGVGGSVQITILDPQGNHVERESAGEISIKGPNVFGGYEGNPEANASSFSNGWFRTGDQGYLDQDGYVVLTGRIKELINRGGEKISPREIDEVLLTHAAVAEAVCFGLPDRVYGEEVAAAVVLSGPTAEADLIKHCKLALSDFKCPKKVFIVDTIPRTATGKIQRRHVASLFSDQ
ncbi:MAG: AMP-dependent synthetase [Blastocatellia bacterium AA13]|nr:MAG: AMP-dependent synthetase [Blastocatellia bacterium AA13]